MKNLKAYMKDLYISLDDINEELKDKIINLEGYEINECHGCGCLGDVECCPCEPECDKCCDPTTVVINQFGRFNSELEITRELDVQPKVNTLYDIHSQFGRFNFVKDIKKTHVEPLYFGHKECCTMNEPVKYDVETIQNKKIYKVVTDIVNTFDLVSPVVQTKINGEVQVYAVKCTGSNGKENSIKTSLEEVAKILTKLDSKSEIQWSQVLDVSIDNIDDLYAFVITFVLDADKVRETIKPEVLNK